MEEAAVILYRAVTEDELMAIETTGTYTVLDGLEGKYFFPTREQALAFVDTGWATVVTSAMFSHSLLSEAEELVVAGEGAALYLPATLFPHGPVIVESQAEG